MFVFMIHVVKWLPSLVLLIAQLLLVVNGSGSQHAQNLAGVKTPDISQDEEPHAHTCARLLVNVESTLGVGEAVAHHIRAIRICIRGRGTIQTTMRM